MTNPIGSFRYKYTVYYLPDVFYHVTDPNCVCGNAYVYACGGPGAGVALNGSVMKGANGTDSGFNNGAKFAVAKVGGKGGIQGDQGPGGTTNGNFDDFVSGRSGGGLGDGKNGGIGGGGVGESWQENGINAPSMSGYGGGAAPVPPGAPAGTQTGTGGGEGAKGVIQFEGRGPYWGTVTDSATQSVIDDNAYRLVVGLPPQVADAGTGGFRGGIPGNGRVVVQELIFEPSAALVALLNP